MEPYPLPARPLPADPGVAPRVDLRPNLIEPGEFDRASPWNWCIDFVRRSVAADIKDAGRHLSEDTITGFRHDGIGAAQLAAVIDALDDGRPVAFYGWWPTEELAAVTDVLGVDAMEVPTPDRKGRGLVDGHAVVLIGYGRHDAFPGGGYFIVRNPWRYGWGDDGVGYLPFTYLRTYAIALRTFRFNVNANWATPVPAIVGDQVRADGVDDDSPVPEEDRLETTLDGRRHPADAMIAKHARCADPRSTYTALFFSDNALDTARARAICSRCMVRSMCLARALERKEPYGVWGGEFVLDGQIVAVKRGRGRPRKVPLPTVVDEVTGEAIVA